MVVAQAGEALAGVEVEIRAPGGVVEIGPLRRRVLPVEAEDPQHADQRWIEMASRQLQGFVGTRLRIRDHAEGVDSVSGPRFSGHGDGRGPYARRQNGESRSNGAAFRNADGDGGN